jgi:hypothetical protein
MSKGETTLSDQTPDSESVASPTVSKTLTLKRETLAVYRTRSGLKAAGIGICPLSIEACKPNDHSIVLGKTPDKQV